MTAGWTDPKPGVLKTSDWIDTGFCTSRRIGGHFIELFGPNTLDPDRWLCLCGTLDLRIGVEAPDIETARERALPLVLNEILRRRDALDLDLLIEGLREAVKETDDAD
jgi:hypothetical protein